jgi:copper resistance protein C
MRRFLPVVLLIGAVLVLPRIALAHAILVESTPAAKSTVQGPDVAIELRFNSRVDGQRSSITLVSPDGHSGPLVLDQQGSQTALHAHTTLKPGSYTLRWQALSTDGHITRGEIPFTVR